MWLIHLCINISAPLPIGWDNSEVYVLYVKFMYFFRISPYNFQSITVKAGVLPHSLLTAFISFINIANSLTIITCNSQTNHFYSVSFVSGPNSWRIQAKIA